MTTALASPTFHDLIALLANERRLLERLLFRHAEISMLVAAGEHRFVGKAIDEALEVETELANCDLVRAMMTSSLDTSGQDIPMSRLLAQAPEDLRAQLEALFKDMKRLMAQVDRYRAEASAWAGERSEQLRSAIERFGSHSY